MNSKLKIPDEAMPVVEVLRRDVPKPTAELRTTGGYSSSPRFVCGKCPMGFLPYAYDDNPVASDFQTGPLSDNRRAVTAFWRWWDNLTLEQARLAVDLIWPTQEQK